MTAEWHKVVSREDNTIMTNYWFFMNAQDSLDNLIGQNVITWGCISGWCRHGLSKSEQRVCAGCSPAVLCDARRRCQPIRMMKIGITRLTHVLWKCFVCPQNVKFANVYLALFNKNYIILLHFLNEIDTGHILWMWITVWLLGLYRRLTTVLCVVTGDKDRPKPVVTLRYRPCDKLLLP